MKHLHFIICPAGGDIVLTMEMLVRGRKHMTACDVSFLLNDNYEYE